MPDLPPDFDSTETHEPLDPRSLRAAEAAAAIPDLRGYALMVATGPQRGYYWLLGEAMTRAGRDPEAPIFLDDVTVSRDHAGFVVEEHRLVVRDLGSTNGTYVNGDRTEEATLAPGDEVIIGRFHLVVAHGA